MIDSISDALCDRYINLARAILARAERDARSKSVCRDALAYKKSALSFIIGSPLASTIGALLDCDLMMLAGRSFGGHVIEHKFYIELNDANGRRDRTNETPVVIVGYVQPLVPGASSVIIVEGPPEFAATWKAVPVYEWVALDGYRGQAGEISEMRYATLLARVCGIPETLRNAANRRALNAENAERKSCMTLTKSRSDGKARMGISTVGKGGTGSRRRRAAG